MKKAIIRFLGCKTGSKPRIFLIALSIFFLFLAYIQYGFSIVCASYVPTPAYISDVDSHIQVHTKFFVREYTYTVQYSYDGESYEDSITTADYPKEGATEIWVDPEDPTQTAGTDIGTMKQIALKILLVSILLFAAWLFLYLHAKTRSYNEDVASDVFISSAICAVTSIFGSLMYFSVILNDSNFANNSFFILCVILSVCFTAIAIMAKSEEKRMSP